MHGAQMLLFLLFDLAVIIAAARLMGGLARRLGQPVVIGEMAAGIILGPSVLGHLVPGLPARLFPAGVPLHQLADLGLIFFMFLVGLELDPRLIRKEGRRALTISLTGVAVPFALGALIGIPLLALNNAGRFAEGVTGTPTPLAFSLFMGAAMCITAFPVLARILVERGLYKSPLGTATLCAAAVDDVTAWILLAGVVGITRSGSLAAAGSSFLLTALFAGFLLTVGRWLLARLAQRHEALGRLTVDQVAVVVVGLLLSAYATEWIGVHAIFGAFLFGAAMPHQSRLARELTDKIEDFTVVVLLPVFFAVAGLRTNLFAIDSSELLLWTLAIVAIAIFGKLAGCGLAARLNGYSIRDSFALGTLMNTRGLTELVILSVGLSLGVLSDRTFAMMVIMALLTTLMAAPILNRIMPRKEMVRVLAGGDPEPMTRRILVALGNPENARALVDVGIRLTGRERPAELLLVRLIPTARAPEFRTGLKDEESTVDRSVDAMDRLAQQVSREGMTARSVSFLSEDVGKDLAYVAATQKCDAILLGWHRASLQRDVVRALVHRVFHFAPCDVIVFVDRRGVGLQPDSGPVVMRTAAGADEQALTKIGQPIAEGLTTALVTVGPEGTVTRASAALIQVGTPWDARAEFGQPATAFAAGADFPVLVVRPGAGTSS
ncbi:MAG TPA: cation:proton antiporter [Chthoniobacterales bacterium]|nr:cation:proton antiporter [Chthoniobacterales bacterium]